MVKMPNDLLSDPAWLAKHASKRREELAKRRSVQKSQVVTIKKHEGAPMDAAQEFQSKVDGEIRKAALIGVTLATHEAYDLVNAANRGLYARATGQEEPSPYDETAAGTVLKRKAAALVRKGEAMTQQQAELEVMKREPWVWHEHLKSLGVPV